MSRLDNQVHEANRKANQATAAQNEKRQAVAKWLKTNPQIGELNGGKYYKIVNGETVTVQELGQ